MDKAHQGKGITLIGMPGSGKSTIGELLAGQLGWSFVDLDDYIARKHGMGHAKILSIYGPDRLSAIEEEYALELDLHKTVFAPGGSMVYAEQAMKRLSRDSLVVYLKVSTSKLEHRLAGVIEHRGIIGYEEKGLHGVYVERKPLFEKYAHITIEGDRSAEEIIKDMHLYVQL